MNVNNINAFLFDMDGVLYNSMPLHEKSWKETFKTINVDYPTEMIYMNEGRPGRETIVEVFKDILNETPDQNTIEELYARKTELMNEMGKADLIAGMPEIIEFLHDRSFNLCVVTGSSQKSLINYINHHYNNRFKDSFITGEDVERGKPAPEPYHKALSLMGCKASEAIVIENAPLGVQAAKAAGIFTVAVNTGKLKNKTLSEAGADIVFDSAIQLREWLRDTFS
ncbi:HAD family hydrolase [Saccharicrinis sp. FJH54]|uniref:HAD family hydrolase n=1 Tax=Saccharicrinis sp. FJH54 TaxID=3344665 RepID=UPI0035D45FEB